MRMLDRTGSGSIDFITFYPLICLMVAIKDRIEKQFIVQHSKFAFKMLDEDVRVKVREAWDAQATSMNIADLIALVKRFETAHTTSKSSSD